MNEEESVKIFDMVVKDGQLPARLEELVPLSFIGQAAVSFYEAKVKLMDQLGMTEDQRKATLADGQDAGKMLLEIEARIGELVDSTEIKQVPRSGGGSTSTLPSEIAGRTNEPKRKNATAIYRNPAAVAEVIREAEENEDIPTKTAVFNKIRADKERAAREKYEREVEAQKTENTAALRGDALNYLSKLREIVLILPVRPPKEGWTEEAHAEARGLVEIIQKRLEVWEDGQKEDH